MSPASRALGYRGVLGLGFRASAVGMKTSVIQAVSRVHLVLAVGSICKKLLTGLLQSVTVMGIANFVVFLTL